MKRVTTAGLIGFALWTLGIIVLHLTSEEGWVRVVDDANLVFHEAGHPIFGILGETPGLYGGTLGQLAVPLLCAWTFLRQGHTVSLGVVAVWFFENFWNIARYIGDARSRLLPLVGGGDHDWTQILASWHLIHHDKALANVVSFIGWVGILGVSGWVAWRWMQDRESALQAPGQMR